MAETLTVTIQAQDGATRVFKAVEGSAASMGKAVEAAGKSGTAGMTSLASEIQRLDDQINTVSNSLLGFGAAITGALTLPLAKGTKAAWDQVSAVEQATFALGAYGDSAEDVNAALQDLTAYAQDASRSGGIFWSQDLFYAAQTLRTLGAEIDDVSEYVQIMSRSVGIGAGSWDRLLEVIGRVGATGRITALDLDELAKMGFQLDRSIAGMAVTWDELFAILDQGIPAEALLGQADTIQGRLEYLQGAFVNLGQAFLGIDEQFQFIEGGLGDQLSQSIGQATDSINNLQDAATALGSGVGSAVSGILSLAEAFSSLSPETQAFIVQGTAYIGMASLFVGATGKMIGPLIRLGGALRDLRRSELAMRTLTAAVNPLTLGVGLLTVAGYSLWDSWREGERVAQSFESAIDSLNSAYEQLLLSGQQTMASNVQLIRDLMADVPRIMQGQYEILSAGLTVDDFEAWYELEQAYSYTAEEAKRFEEVQVSLGQRLSDSRMDTQALTDEIERLYNLFLTDPDFTGDDLLAALEELDARAVEDFRLEAVDAIEAIVDLTGSINILNAGLYNLQNVGTATMQALRAEADDTAESFAAMAQTLYQLETEMVPTSAANAISIVTDGLNAIPPAAQKAGNAIFDMVAGTAQTQLDEFTASVENIRSLLDSMGMMDPLALWDLSGHASDVMALTQETLQFGQALDSVLGIYGQIDAMSQRMSSAGGIADALFGPDGDPYDAVGPMRDVFDAGLISLEQFNAAIEDGIAIQEQAAQSELYLNKIRVDQLPILRETTDAYAEQIRLISEMDPQEQMVALGWMDQALQSQVQNFTDLVSEMNNFGTAGDAAMQQVIDGIVATDPVLTAMLEDLGLIQQQMDGSYVLSLDAEGAISDMERLTASIDALTIALGGTPPTYDVDVQTSVNGEPTGPEGIAGVLRGALDNVMGGETGIDLPVNPQLPPNASDLLQQSFGGQAVEIEVTPVISTAMDFLTGGIGSLLGGDSGPQDVAVTIDAVDNATPVIDNVTAQLIALNAWNATIDISAPNAYTTIGDLNGVQSAAEAVPDSVTTWALVAGHTDAIGNLNGVQAAAEAIPSSVTTVISAVDNASAVIGDAVSFMASVDGYTSTMTLNVVTNQITRIRTENARHGGIPGYAHGGVIAELAEAGPEVLHFASGGTATVYDRGFYGVPAGTYVSPNNTYTNDHIVNEGTTVELHIHGNVYGIDDLTDAMASAATKFFAGQGGGV